MNFILLLILAISMGKSERDKKGLAELMLELSYAFTLTSE